jgi:hypothetical protein
MSDIFRFDTTSINLALNYLVLSMSASVFYVRTPGFIIVIHSSYNFTSYDISLLSIVIDSVIPESLFSATPRSLSTEPSKSINVFLTDVS